MELDKLLMKILSEKCQIYERRVCLNFDQLSDRFKVFPGMSTYTNAYIKGQKSILDVQQENLRNDLQKFA